MDLKELKEMRKAVEGLFPDFCNLLAVTRTGDGAGGFTEAWGTAVRNVPCRMDQMTGAEAMTDGSLRKFASLELCLPYEETITEAHRVEYAGLSYNVRNVDGDTSWQIEKIVQLERI